jgi:hypothetical protein
MSRGFFSFDTALTDSQASLLVTGINASKTEVEAGRNPNCRVLSYKDNE